MNRTFQIRGMSFEIPEQGSDFIYQAGRNAVDAMLTKHSIEETERQFSESLRKRGGKQDEYDRGFAARLSELKQPHD